MYINLLSRQSNNTFKSHLNSKDIFYIPAYSNNIFISNTVYILLEQPIFGVKKDGSL